MVPEPLYTVGELIGDGERIALDPRDGELYSCYNDTVDTFSLEFEMYCLVRECEEGVIECEKQIAEEKKTPEEKQKEEEEYLERLKAYKAFIEERKRERKVNDD